MVELQVTEKPVRAPLGRADAGRRIPRPRGFAALFRPETHVLISNAYAQTPAAAPGSDLMAFLPMILIFVVFYFLLIRPQQKKAKEHRAMLGALQKGDEVVTAGGVVGRVSKLSDQYASIEIAPSVEINVQRSAIAQLLPKGTIKAL
jgi:preprotein translocase subunit YajC